jgi:excisionase family DNA binding protein
MNEIFYTIPEVAELLKISRSRAYAWARNGWIPCVKIGRTIRVRESDLVKWIEEQVKLSQQVSDVWYFPRIK